MFAWLKSLFCHKPNIVRVPEDGAVGDLAYPDEFASITAAMRSNTAILGKARERPECCRKYWGEADGYGVVIFGGCLLNPIGSPMITCVKCGNKRCPKATDCDLDCSGSNLPGQKGSVYGLRFGWNSDNVA